MTDDNYHPDVLVEPLTTLQSIIDKFRVVMVENKCDVDDAMIADQILHQIAHSNGRENLSSTWKTHRVQNAIILALIDKTAEAIDSIETTLRFDLAMHIGTIHEMFGYNKKTDDREKYIKQFWLAVRDVKKTEPGLHKTNALGYLNKIATAYNRANRAAKIKSDKPNAKSTKSPTKKSTKAKSTKPPTKKSAKAKSVKAKSTTKPIKPKM